MFSCEKGDDLVPEVDPELTEACPEGELFDRAVVELLLGDDLDGEVDVLLLPVLRDQAQSDLMPSQRQVVVDLFSLDDFRDGIVLVFDHSLPDQGMENLLQRWDFPLDDLEEGFLDVEGRALAVLDDDGDALTGDVSGRVFGLDAEEIASDGLLVSDVFVLFDKEVAFAIDLVIGHKQGEQLLAAVFRPLRQDHLVGLAFDDGWDIVKELQGEWILALVSVFVLGAERGGEGSDLELRDWLTVLLFDAYIEVFAEIVTNQEVLVVKLFGLEIGRIRSSYDLTVQGSDARGPLVDDGDVQGDDRLVPIVVRRCQVDLVFPSDWGRPSFGEVVLGILDCRMAVLHVHVPSEEGVDEIILGEDRSVLALHLIDGIAPDVLDIVPLTGRAGIDRIGNHSGIGIFGVEGDVNDLGRNIGIVEAEPLQPPFGLVVEGDREGMVLGEVDDNRVHVLSSFGSGVGVHVAGFLEEVLQTSGLRRRADIVDQRPVWSLHLHHESQTAEIVRIGKFPDSILEAKQHHVALAAAHGHRWNFFSIGITGRPSDFQDSQIRVVAIETWRKQIPGGGDKGIEVSGLTDSVACLLDDRLFHDFRLFFGNLSERQDGKHSEDKALFLFHVSLPSLLLSARSTFFHLFLRQRNFKTCPLRCAIIPLLLP